MDFLWKLCFSYFRNYLAVNKHKFQGLHKTKAAEKQMVTRYTKQLLLLVRTCKHKPTELNVMSVIYLFFLYENDLKTNKSKAHLNS